MTRLTCRVIACLDVRDGAVVKGVQFEGLRTAGDPAALAARYNADGVDELVMLDVSATLEGRRATAATIARIAAELSVPFTVGGGIRSLDDARIAFDAGADKVAVNSAALARPALLGEIAARYGRQAVVLAIDAKWQDGVARVFSRSATAGTAREAAEWAADAEQIGAGEILLTSIDRDGTRAGFDLDLIRAVRRAVGVPVIASGGAGSREHFADVFAPGTDDGADAALAASIFHYAEHGITDLKRWLATQGVPVRLPRGGTAC